MSRAKEEPVLEQEGRSGWKEKQHFKNVSRITPNHTHTGGK
jgi:hypothetical protein